jgi:hypothetical protein
MISPGRCSSAPPYSGLVRKSRTGATGDLQLELDTNPNFDELVSSSDVSPSRRSLDPSRPATSSASEPQLSPILSADRRNAGLPPRKPYHLADTIHVDFRSPKSSSVRSSMASPIPNARTQLSPTVPDFHGEHEKSVWRDAFNEKRDELQQALKEVEWARKQAESLVHEKVVAASLVTAVSLYSC